MVGRVAGGGHDRAVAAQLQHSRSGRTVHGRSIRPANEARRGRTNKRSVATDHQSRQPRGSSPVVEAMSGPAIYRIRDAAAASAAR